jgi:hypothetical protein
MQGVGLESEGEVGLVSSCFCVSLNPDLSPLQQNPVWEEQSQVSTCQAAQWDHRQVRQALPVLRGVNLISNFKKYIFGGLNKEGLS